MAKLLTDDVALVTGAGRGIGRGIATRLAAHGCDVAINDIDSEAADTVAMALHEEYGVETTTAIGDVSTVDDAERIVDETVERFGALDVLVNNAAIISPQQYDEIDERTWRQVLDVNVTGVQNCSAAAFSEMKAQGGGRIVNIASTAGLRISLLAGAHYTTSKWGVVGLTKHVAQEGGEYGIRANAVCPGPTETERINEMTDEKQRLETAEAEIPLGRWGRPDDVGKATVFLASDLAEYVTGIALPVDGGFTVQ
ncbi:SDR family NAD(P)-dependent oxidoreductase [Natronosalvus rutilus]|uniref:Glucose 1-dehydrogenase n=1 Tax=Natronosalvus rutilus TaxID=2953753 RepID=A0A9E7NDD0_9EURY|nr:glucose 1-dehydrogenase [Natronosalvus rutilus]UTF55815.1 glucose 1-dehydrogenase [Natronosalvus rutilus]